VITSFAYVIIITVGYKILTVKVPNSELKIEYKRQTSSDHRVTLGEI